MFKVQRSILARYHMTDPYNWYLQSGLWEVPNDPVGGANSNAKETPYYLSVKWPGDEDPIFSLTSVYVPRGRSNLAAYMAVERRRGQPRTTASCGSCGCRTPPRSTVRARRPTRW